MIFLVRGRTVGRCLSALDMIGPVSDITAKRCALMKRRPVISL